MKKILTTDLIISIILTILPVGVIIGACWLYQTMPDNLSVSTVVTLTYFKRCGKYYTTGTYESLYSHSPDIYEQVDKMVRKGINPGLVDGAVLRNEFAVLVQPKDGVPYLFTDFKAR